MTLAVRQMHVGDCRELLKQMPDESVNCVVTSPPYWGLRDYGIKPSKWADRWVGCLGLEPSPQMFVKHMVEVFREVHRVLRSDGTLWLNLGDSYCASARGSAGNKTTLDSKRHVAICGAPIDKRGARGDRLPNGRGKITGRKTFRRDGAAVGGPPHKSGPGLKPKDLIGVPWRVAFALQADGWWFRSDIVWAKPNPMPESVTDRPTKAHEYLFLMSRSASYYYDADAIKEPVTGNAHSRGAGVNPKAAASGFKTKQNASFSAAVTGLVGERNKRSVWTVATEPYDGAHFATFPRKLVEPCILAGCPRGGVVLDPFGGSGTVGEVAEALGRNWILFDLNPEYAELARKRTAQRGLFVETKGDAA